MLSYLFDALFLFYDFYMISFCLLFPECLFTFATYKNPIKQKTKKYLLSSLFWNLLYELLLSASCLSRMLTIYLYELHELLKRTKNYKKYIKVKIRNYYEFRLVILYMKMILSKLINACYGLLCGIKKLYALIIYKNLKN